MRKVFLLMFDWWQLLTTTPVRCWRMPLRSSHELRGFDPFHTRRGNKAPLSAGSWIQLRSRVDPTKYSCWFCFIIALFTLEPIVTHNVECFNKCASSPSDIAIATALGTTGVHLWRKAACKINPKDAVEDLILGQFCAACVYVVLFDMGVRKTLNTNWIIPCVSIAFCCHGNRARGASDCVNVKDNVGRTETRGKYKGTGGMMKSHIMQKDQNTSFHPNLI